VPPETLFGVFLGITNQRSVSGCRSLTDQLCGF